ncbi:hypothetical protein BBJ28_00003735 [Nothophytophthora sp. Chile5]|nr:hypothetical protein BBJ28_00003735 [Nothophytophthora sp. Chile5]
MNIHDALLGLLQFNMLLDQDDQGLVTFYTETKSIQQELEVLRVTIYEQEIRFREYELQLQEKQESLDFLVQQVKKLPELYPTQATEDLVSSNLPSWCLVGAKMVWQQFDGDHDGFLTREELNQLKNQLRKAHGDIDEVLPTPRDDEDPALEPLTARSLLKLYTTGGATKLADDLRSLGILYAAADAASLSKAKRELAAARHAVLDLRALVDE